MKILELIMVQTHLHLKQFLLIGESLVQLDITVLKDLLNHPLALLVHTTQIYSARVLKIAFYVKSTLTMMKKGNKGANHVETLPIPSKER